jgi:hypothetical protein
MEIAKFQVAINDLPKGGHCDRSSVSANPHPDFVAVGVTPELKETARTASTLLHRARRQMQLAQRHRHLGSG